MELLNGYLEEYNRMMQCAEFDALPDKIGADGFLTSVGYLMNISLGRVFFIGNGGSAGICSHMATDYSKNGKIKSLALNDSSALTCIGNDLGFDQIFAEQLRWNAWVDDVLVAVSSSGNSPDILEAVRAAKKIDMSVITLSGFAPDNKLRTMGDYNCYLPSMSYGHVEVGHTQILHAILDIHMGWGR